MDWTATTRHIKNASRLEEVASELGVALKRQGKELVGRCPLPGHEDEHPSFNINPKKQLFICRSCGRGGDVYTFVMSVKNLSFIQAREFLAQRSSVRIDESVRFSGSESVFEAAVNYWQRKVTTKETLRNIDKKWGVKPETVGILRIGLAGSRGLFKHLRKSGFSRKSIRKSGLFRKSSKKWRPFFNKHLIFPVIRNGKVCNFVGRALPLDHEPKPKYLKLPNGAKPRFSLYNVDSVRSDKRLVIVEGYGDASALHQLGFAVVAIGGTDVSEIGMNQLAKISARASQTCIFFDFDESGQVAAQKLAKRFLRFGIHARLVLRPEKLRSKIKDPADFVSRSLENRQDLEKLLTDAIPLIDIVMDRLPDKVPPGALEATLDEPLKLIAQLDPVTSDAYIKALAKKLKLQRRALLRVVKRIREEMPRGNERNSGEAQDYCEIEPSLGVIDSISYFILPISKWIGRKLTVQPCMVTSRKDFIQIADEDDTELNGKRLILRSPPLFLPGEARWERVRLRRFLTESKKVNPLRLFLSIRRQAKRYLEFQEAGVPDLLAIWIMGTYLYPHFETYPYLQFYGPKGSGKTKTLTFLAAMAFNALVTSSIKPAGLFRIVERSGATLLLDEAERLNNRDNPELAELLRAGYKKPSFAIRVQESSLEPRFFNVFSPKAIANIKGLDDVLGSRCIPISMVRSLDRNKVNRDLTLRSKKWPALRSKLYRLALEHSSAIRQAYASTCRKERNKEVHGRNLELWAPIFAVATFVESSGAHKGLVKRLRSLAKRKVEEHRVSSLDDWDTAFLLALYKLTADGNSRITTMNVKLHMGKLLPEEGFPTPSSKWIGRAIHRFNLGPGRKIMGSYRYQISRSSVEDLLERYEVEYQDRGGLDSSAY